MPGSEPPDIPVVLVPVPVRAVPAFPLCANAKEEVARRAASAGTINFLMGVSSMDELQQPGPRTRVPDSPHHLQAVRKLRVTTSLEKSWFHTCEYIVRVSRVADSQIRRWRLRCGRRSSDE
jgi:hypothetical protein